MKHHNDRLLFLIDLRVQFFFDPTGDLDSIPSKLTFVAEGLPESPKYHPETISVDFESDWAEDDPAFMATMDEMNGARYFPYEPSLEKDFPETVSACLSNPALTEYFFFSKVVVEVDAEFDWDFEDEDGMEFYDEKIKHPFFNSLRLDFGDLHVHKYILELHDII